MGCGASKIVEQQPALNNNVQDIKGNLNGQAQQVVNNNVPKSVQQQARAVRDTTKPADQDKPVSNTPEKQARPVQQVQPVQQQAPEPEKPLSPKEDEQTNGKPAPTYTEESLQEILELEKKLSSMESVSNGVVGEYQTQHKLLVSHYADLQAAQKKVEGLKQQTAKEYHDVAAMQHPNVRAMFTDVYHLQSQMAKEQREYMDALNRQEVAEKELKIQQEEYNALYAEVEALQKKCEELQILRAEREKKLDGIFDGKYGSELEEQLEAETDLLTERKEMITKTRNYWNNAKVLMEHAVKQLAFSTRRWAQINTVNQSFVQARYSMVAETRNYLIAASQNITNTHRFLSNVNIPYCNSEDLKVLNRAIATIFNDSMNRESYMRALQTYSALNSNANSLLQWIIMVLEKTISKDLEKVVPLWQQKLWDLKRERLSLIHVKIRELQGKDTSEAIPDEVLMIESEPMPENLSEVQSDTHIAEPDTVSLKDDNENVEDIPPPPTPETSVSPSTDVPSPSTTEGNVAQPSQTDENVPPPPTTQGGDSLSSTTEGDIPSQTSEVEATPPVPGSESEDPTKASETAEDSAAVDSKAIADLLETAMKVKPLIELAPVPEMDVLFGNIEELKTKYEEQVAQFSKAQDVNKARLDQALQDKLQARRIRKQAIELQELDTSELAKGVTSRFGIKF